MPTTLEDLLGALGGSRDTSTPMTSMYYRPEGLAEIPFKYQLWKDLFRTMKHGKPLDEIQQQISLSEMLGTPFTPPPELIERLQKARGVEWPTREPKTRPQGMADMSGTLGPMVNYPTGEAGPGRLPVSYKPGGDIRKALGIAEGKEAMKPVTLDQIKALLLSRAVTGEKGEEVAGGIVDSMMPGTTLNKAVTIEGLQPGWVVDQRADQKTGKVAWQGPPYEAEPGRETKAKGAEIDRLQKLIADEEESVMNTYKVLLSPADATALAGLDVNVSMMLLMSGAVGKGLEPDARNEILKALASILNMKTQLRNMQAGRAGAKFKPLTGGGAETWVRDPKTGKLRKQ